MKGRQISREEYYKRFKKPSKEDLLNDPDTRESMSDEIKKFLDSKYALYREMGLSHEDATIGSRRDAGVAVDALSKIGAQNQQNVDIYLDNRDQYADVNKLLEFVEAAKEPYSERASEVKRQNAMALDNLIESVRAELGVYGPYNKESSKQKADNMAMPGTQARRKEASKGDNFLNRMLEKLSKGDKAYANMLGSNIKGDSKRATYRRLLEATPLSEIKVTGADSPIESIQANLAATGLRAANVGVRYMLPAGAATAGAVGLMELTNALSPADYQEEGQIRMS